MLNPAHLLEVALLLLAAFLIGAVVGTLLRLLARRIPRPASARPAPAESVAAEDPFPVTALVAAPVIEPLPQPARPADPVPLKPEDIPIPDFAAALQELAKDAPAKVPLATPVIEAPPAAEPPPPASPGPLPPRDHAPVDWSEIRPARTPGEATSGRHFASSQSEAPETLAPAVVAEVIPFPFAAAPARPAAANRPADPEIAWEAVPVPEPAKPLAGPGTAAASPPVVAEPDAFIEMPTAALVAELAAMVENARRPALPEPKTPTEPVNGAAEAPAAPTIAPPGAARADQETLLAGLPAAAEGPVPEPDVGSVSDVALVVTARAPEPSVGSVAEDPAPAEQARIIALAASPEAATAVATAIAEKSASPAAIESRPVGGAGPIAATLPVGTSLPAAGGATAADPGVAVEFSLSAARQAALTPEPPAAPLQAGDVEDDDDREAAAMRAIEGNWTPGRVSARAARRLDPPEGVSPAVSASAAAIAAAARAVEAVVADSSAPGSLDDGIDLVAALNAALATDAPDASGGVPPPEPEPEPGRPVGLDAPRHGVKDDLTHVIGILPAIELQLNQLGIYHFDQLAGLDEENVAWLETHLATPGRVRRELWREQARELEAALRPRAATGS